jgi:hypothetical protein
MGLRLDRVGARALFCGDAIHSPIQILQPTVSTFSCRDPELAARTRIALLQEAAATDRVLVPATSPWRREAIASSRRFQPECKTAHTRGWDGCPGQNHEQIYSACTRQRAVKIGF